MTIKLHELPPDPGARQKRHRIGRGESSGWGKSSGHGAKGAQARSGAAKRGAFEGGQTTLTRRVPKFGFSNVKFRIPRAAITLGALDRFEEGTSVDLAALRGAGLIAKRTRYVKVIATGKLTTKLTVRLHGYSQAAREAIEARGGTCEVLKP